MLQFHTYIHAQQKQLRIIQTYTDLYLLHILPYLVHLDHLMKKYRVNMDQYRSVHEAIVLLLD